MSDAIGELLASFYRERILDAVAVPEAQRRLDRATDLLRDEILADPRSKLEDRKRDAQLPFLLFVVGVGNVGKSSLINALAGRVIAPVKITPLTWKIDLYEPSEQDSADIHWVGGQWDLWIPIPRAEEICAAEEVAAKEARRRGEPYRGRIVEVRWRRSGTRLPAGLLLVDTPGIHQLRADTAPTETPGYRPLMEASEELVGLAETYLYRADAVLWLLRATNLADAAGRAIEELSFFKREQFAVLNFADDPQCVPEATLAEARRLFGRWFRRFMLFSAKRACENPSEGGLPELEQLIHTEFRRDSRRKKALATLALVDAEFGASESICRAEALRIRRGLEAMDSFEVSTATEVDGEVAALKREARTRVEKVFREAVGKIDRSFGERLVKASEYERPRILAGLGLESNAKAAIRASGDDSVRALSDWYALRVANLAFDRPDYDFRGMPSGFKSAQVGHIAVTSQAGSLEIGSLSISALDGVSFESVAAGVGSYIAMAFLVNPLVGVAVGILTAFGLGENKRFDAAATKAREAINNAQQHALGNAESVVDAAADAVRRRYLESASRVFEIAFGPHRHANQRAATLEAAGESLVLERQRPIMNPRLLIDRRKRRATK